MNDASSTDDDLLELADEFAACVRRGDKPSLADYTARRPELASRIRELFPMMMAMEELRSVAGEVADATTNEVGSDIPRQLGDYRILRELGRGGMGIVYEAVQESLGRHVALKVLFWRGEKYSTYAERFCREARMAARLHHTNIVPVFGVGQQGGLYYYAMQFIQGQSLDLVLRELRRWRRSSTEGNANQTPRLPLMPIDTADSPADRAASESARADVTGIALGLVSDAFEPPAAPPAAPATAPAPGPAPSGASAANPATGRIFAASTETSHIYQLQSQPQYFRSVARVGLQVADALAHAHQQGILHRDIKPANLMLDLRGTVWVTDFGLAKADDSEGLTRAGDIVGTLRYMAPERFQGDGDARSDLFSLGVTLYEMLVLQAAFAASDRAQLIHRLVHDEPPPPRKLDAAIPRDLETIVLKLIAKEPCRRYEQAAAVADDLRRFLADRPIQARRLTVLEKSWRWCLRNRAFAGSFAVALILSVMVAGVLFVNGLLRRQRDLAISNERLATRSQKVTESLLERATRAERENAVRAHLFRAASIRRGGHRGQKLEALEELRCAMRLDPPSPLRLALRNEAIASLALPDVRTQQTWKTPQEGPAVVAFDGARTRYAITDRLGNVFVRRVSDDAVLQRISGLSVGEAFPLLSSNGNYLAVAHPATPPAVHRVRLWGLQDAAPELVLDVHPAVDFLWGFSPSDRYLLVRKDQSVALFDLSHRQFQNIPTDAAVIYHAALAPDDQRLATITESGVQVRDLQTGDVQQEWFAEVSSSTALAWHPEGTMLAALTGDRKLRLLDPLSGQQILRAPHGDGGILSFDARGNYLASSSWESVLRIWDIRANQQLVQTPCHMSTAIFGSQDLTLDSEWTDDQFHLLQFLPSEVRQSLVHPAMLDGNTYLDCDVHPNGQVLAALSHQDISFWDLKELRFAGAIPMEIGNSLAFHPDGSLWTNSPHEVVQWHLARNPKTGTVQVTRGKRAAIPGSFDDVAWAANGRVLVTGHSDGASIVHEPDQASPMSIIWQAKVFSIGLSPDGKYLATGSHGFSDVARIWDLGTGASIQDLSAPGLQQVVFSPDGRYLAIATTEIQVFRTDSWTRVAVIPRDAPLGPLLFTVDSRMLVFENGHGVLRFWDLHRQQECAAFEDPYRLRATNLATTPDGSQLIATSRDGPSIQVWNLQAIRASLQELSLDW